MNKFKKWIIPAVILAILVLLMIAVLVSNKRKIDKANTRVDRTQIPVSVNIAEVATGTLNRSVSYPAFIQPSEEAMVYAQASGMISSLPIELGKQVKKGEVIGKMDTRILELNLKNATVNLRSATVNKEKMHQDYLRAKDLFDNQAGLEVNMLTAKNSYDNASNTYDNAVIQVDLIRQQIDNANIVAPIGGIISMHKVKQGEFINPGTPIATISNISTVKTTVYLDQQMSYHITKGMLAEVTTPLFGERTFSGKVIYTSPVADANHNYQVDLQIVNAAGGLLKGGTDVQVTFNMLTLKQTMLIPASAVMTDAKVPYVFVADEGKAKARNIKTGMIQNDRVEILDGLKPGERVIINGQINLKEGSNINIIQ